MLLAIPEFLIINNIVSVFNQLHRAARFARENTYKAVEQMKAQAEKQGPAKPVVRSRNSSSSSHASGAGVAAPSVQATQGQATQGRASSLSSSSSDRDSDRDSDSDRDADVATPGCCGWLAACLGRGNNQPSTGASV